MAIKQMEQQTLPIFAEPEKKVFLRGFLIKVLNSYAAMYIKNLRALSMKKPTSEQISEFVLFASPCYWLLALIFIALVIWKVGFNEPDLIPPCMGEYCYYSFSNFPCEKISLGNFTYGSIGCIHFFALQNNQHFGHIFQLYGVYLILHYSACCVYVFKNRKKE